MASFAVVGLVPFAKWRRWLNDAAFKLTFILISGSLSAEIEFHNPEFRPKNCGFCVANHTSPIDISILSTDCTYSLVRTGRGSSPRSRKRRRNERMPSNSMGTHLSHTHAHLNVHTLLLLLHWPLTDPPPPPPPPPSRSSIACSRCHHRVTFSVCRCCT